MTKTVFACAALMLASGALAQKAGDNIVGAGVASINTEASLGTLNNSTSAAVLGVNNGATVGQLLTGASAKVSSETTVSFSWLHLFTDNIGTEVTLGLPPRVTQDLNSPRVGAHPGAAKIDVLTPAVVAKYFFRTAQDDWRPYVGLGVSRVSFRNISVQDDGGVVTALAGRSASLSSSWTVVYNLGMIYNITDKWSVNGSIAYLPIKTRATFVGANAGATVGNVSLYTTDYVLRIGYKF